MKETLKEAGYTYIKGHSGVHVLLPDATVEDYKPLYEVWYANKNHASYGIKYKNTHLEFGYSIKPENEYKFGL